MKPRCWLLTGLPGCGKTTVVCRVLELLAGLRVAGFYTEEIRSQGRRLGFRAAGLSGASVVMAHEAVRSPVRVSRYGVDLDALDRLIGVELDKPFAEVDLYVIDEIGKMECHSPRFIAATRRVLDSPIPLLATIAMRGEGFIAVVKARADAVQVLVTPANRDRLPAELAAAIRQAAPPRGV